MADCVSVLTSCLVKRRGNRVSINSTCPIQASTTLRDYDLTARFGEQYFFRITELFFHRNKVLEIIQTVLVLQPLARVL